MKKRTQRENLERKLPEYNDNRLKTASERIIFDEVTSDDDNYIVDFAKELIMGKPLILNFREINVDEANKIVSFLSGVIFAINGIIEEIDDKIFLFARKQDFKDGTLKKFIEDVKQR